jgi:hypothetical protein
MTTSDINAGIALTDIKYKILLPTLKGGGFWRRFKIICRKWKECFKTKSKKIIVK